jgi:hypothetical protein
VRHERAEPGGDRDLRHRAGHRDRAYREQVGDREVEPDAEHEQDHAELGELRGEPGVGHVARGERAHGDAGQEVAEDRRQPEPRGEQAEEEGQPEPGRDGGDERGVVRHDAVGRGVANPGAGAPREGAGACRARVHGGCARARADTRPRIAGRSAGTLAYRGPNHAHVLRV